MSSSVCLVLDKTPDPVLSAIWFKFDFVISDSFCCISAQYVGLYIVQLNHYGMAMALTSKNFCYKKLYNTLNIS